MSENVTTTKKIRRLVLFFITVIMLSGITAFPVHTELKFILSKNIVAHDGAIGQWLLNVYEGVDAAQRYFPFLFYGFDWLAFAHIIIGILFIGVYKNPVKNIWIIQWGMICCAGVFPLAFICGSIREIPWFHILIDCSFGFFGFFPLYRCHTLIRKLEAYRPAEKTELI
jgi:hypothetical protein